MKDIIKKILIWKLTIIARGILFRYRPKIIAVTGNVGKTSTKDAIYVAIRHLGRVRKSEKSFNSEFGVPLSIIGAKSGWNNPLAWVGIILNGLWQIIRPFGVYPKTLVLEVGADRPGDIRAIAKWLRPHVVVLTRLPEVPVHIEFFPTVNDLAKEKMALVEFLRKEGTFIWNADDTKIRELKESYRVRSLSYGTNEDSDMRASDVQFIDPVRDPEGHGGITYKVNFAGKSFPVTLTDIYSDSFVYVSLAALAVAETCGANMVQAIGALREYETPPGRARFIAGLGGTVLIDDTYNSSPTACEAGLTMLKAIPFGKRKIAVIGDMLELGKYTNEAHEAIGLLAKKCADILITVGVRARASAESARGARMAARKVIAVDTASEASEELKKILEEGDVVFLKGSQGVRLEKTVKALMAEPEKARELLVRQDEEWTKK